MDAKPMQQEQQEGGVRAPTAFRQAHWRELSVEDKVERMREVLKGEIQQTNYIMAALRRLMRHTHGNLGEILIRLVDASVSPPPDQFNPDDPDGVYF